MNQNKMDGAGSISEGFRIAGLNWGLFIVFTILLFGVSFIIGLIPIVSNLFSTFIAPILAFGFAIGAHRVATTGKLDFGDFFKGFEKFVPFLLNILLKLLISLIFSIPLIMLLIDGLGGAEEVIKLTQIQQMPSEEQQEYFRTLLENLSNMNFLYLILAFLLIMIPSILFMFSSYFIWFRNESPTDSLRSSYELVSTNLGQIIIYAILAFLVTLVCAIPCGIGLLFSVPALAAASYHLFKTGTGLEDGDNALKTEDHLILK